MENAIAVIGLSGRFPGAKNVQTFWKQLCEGKDTLSSFSNEELKAAGTSLSQIQSPHYVRKRGVLSEVEMFDASFFGMSDKEAEVTDPQQRIFLECAWEALENGGYSGDHYSGLIGVYGGMGRSTYFLHHLFPHRKLMETLGDYLIRIGNEPDFLTTRVSYKLNLKGPSLSIQTACSSALTSVCIACNQLLTYQCDMALAGGVSITLPQESGYLHQSEMIFSSDGTCRPFDATASGTVPSNGVGIVLLKRLEDAIVDGDSIYAVIRGYGLNNDGAEKMGFSAPSVRGQKEAIEAAILMAGIDPVTIQYVEAHGTGTILGDPIELEALTQAFGATNQTQFCAIGSVKSNIGHTMEAAGVAGLIKAILALQQKKIPPTLHFKTSNPNIDFQNSPFYVNNGLQEWKTGCNPRRAGVSSFGFGGTNAHIILEEAPETTSSLSSNSQLLVLSAKTPNALKKMATNLAYYLQENPHFSLANIAYTLQVGRKEFKEKIAFVCRDLQEAIISLQIFEQQPTDETQLLELGDTWASGGCVDWLLLHQKKRQRIPLPTYPFEKKRYWIDPPSQENRKIDLVEQSLVTSLLEIEEVLIAIWKEFLGSEAIGIHDDFFFLGGDSLLAIQVLSQIEVKLHSQLPLASLYEHSTIAQLALLIAQQHISPSSNLVKLKSGSGHKTLFLVHAIEGSVLSCKALADSISFEGSIFGIEANYSEKNHQTIEQIASSYISSIKTVQPYGPYSLFGSSFGALIAYEIARQMQNSGEFVEWLGMLDVLHPQHELLQQKDSLGMMAFLLELLEGEEISVEALKMLSSTDLKKRLIQSIGLHSFPLAHQHKIYEQIKKHLQALRQYTPQPYHGNISFFEVKNRFFRAKEVSLGSTWKHSVKGPMLVHEISGDHSSMMQHPHVADLAKHIEYYLFQASNKN